MKISHTGAVIGTIAPTTSQAKDAAQGPKGDRKSPARRDSVEISDSARALEARTESPLTPERVREIRDRIKSGAYDTVEVFGSIANRILDRGDV